MTDYRTPDWANEQMNKVDASEDQKEQVQALLDIYWEREDPTVLDMFSKLSQGEPLKVEDSEWRWLDAKPGNVFVRDLVRVRADAYPTKDARSVHNGRVGVVVGIRYGTVSVHYTEGPGSEVPASFTQHRLPLLEKRY